MKELIRTLAKDIPEVRNSILSAMKNVHPSHLLDDQLSKTTDFD